MKISYHSAELFKMQDEVRRLLDLSTHSLSNDSPLVSPEGLGSSDFSSESIGKPIGRPLGSSLHHWDRGILNSNSYKYLTSMHPSVGYSASCQRPEDDILYQWRLRRKMEQSGHQLQSGAQLAVPPSSLCSLPQQTASNMLTRDQSSPVGTMTQTSPYTRAQEPINTFTFPHPSLSQFQPKQHTSPSPFHQSCVLAGPLHSSPILLPQERKQKKSSTDPDMCPQLEADQRSFTNTSDNQHNKPQSALHQHFSEDKGGHCCSSEKSCKGGKAVTSQGEGTKAKKGKKRNGTSSSREKGSRPVDHVSQSDLAQGGGVQEGRRLKHCKDSKGKGESSALQSTLGMVVSEVLFPDSESADTPRISSITDSYEDTQSLPLQSFPTPDGLQRPAEIINNLLIAAEDSDGLEFEDDPLLVVLREQRDWVKRRICDMDILLDTWAEKQPL